MTARGKQDSNRSTPSALRPTICHAWRALGLGGEPGPVVRSPFAHAQGAIFFASLDGRRWYDTGLRRGGGVLDLLGLALGVERDEARWLVRELERDVAAGQWGANDANGGAVKKGGA